MPTKIWRAYSVIYCITFGFMWFKNNKKIYSKETLIFSCILMMLVGFFISRALLSIGMTLMGIIALWKSDPRKWFERKAWLWGVAWVGLFGISYFWSDNDAYWLERFQVKLPILLLPLAFAYTPAMNFSKIRLYTLVLLILLSVGCIYTVSFLLTDPQKYIQGYAVSSVLPTLPENDHIRFSMMCALGSVWIAFIYPFIYSRAERVILWIVFILLGATLHILAARTGLVAYYLFLLLWWLRAVFRSSSRKPALLIGAAGLTILLLAAMFVPTLEERIDYFEHSLEIYAKGERSGNYSDIGRFNSYYIAGQIIRENPLYGVGAGDIMQAMSDGYDKWYPEIPEKQRLVPHNQWLTVGVATGIPGLILFTLWWIYPLKFVRKNRKGYFFLICWIMLFVPLMVEPVLEIQFGVFVCLLPILWQWLQYKNIYPAAKPKN